jgi:glucokinase
VTNVAARKSALRDIARERGVNEIALGQMTLARRADIAIVIDHVEDVQTKLSMVGGTPHLLVIDTLAVGLAQRRNDQPDHRNGYEVHLAR